MTSNPSQINASLGNPIYTSVDSSNKRFLENAKDLGKKNSATLGMMPEGAFDEAAKKGWVIYLVSEGVAVGYLLFRVAKERVVIAHLCVAQSFRRSGGARKLFETLKEVTNDGICRGIEVRCRCDYEIYQNLWHRLGFEFCRRVPGRAKKPTELGVWFYRYDVPDFFYKMMPKQSEDDRVWAVLDANIIFKLNDPSKKESQEACALKADTFSPFVRYFITPEIFAEIERKKDKDKRDSSRSYAYKHEILEVPKRLIEKYSDEISEDWGEIEKPRDRSDFNHVVYSIAGGAQVLLTQDAELLEKSDYTEKNWGLRILRPAQFINEIDAFENSERYNPKSVARTPFKIRDILQSDVYSLAEFFLNRIENEKRSQLEASLNASVANCTKCQSKAVFDLEGNPRAIVVSQKFENKTVIKIFRSDKTSEGYTFLQKLLWDLFSEESKNEAYLFSFEDGHILDHTKPILKKRGFLKTDTGWVRVSAFKNMEATKASRFLKRIVEDQVPDTDTNKEQILETIEKSCKDPSVMEEAFWPIKITDSQEPAIMIPIQPTWAMHLFDTHLAEKELFGAEPNKHFRLENVYYRSSRGLNKSNFSRILWYVSSDKTDKISAVKACSRVVSIETASATALFKKYERYGIYQWKDLLRTAKNDPFGEVMAIRFSHTELFDNPIQRLKLKDFGIMKAPQSPIRIMPEHFLSIYNLGISR